MTTMPSYEIPTEMRDFAEKSVEQARKAFEGFMGAAQKAAGTVEGTTSTVQSSAKSVGSKAVSFAEANIGAAFDHAQKLVRAKDLQELMSLQTEYVKSQMSAFQGQAKELGSAIQVAGQTTADHASQQ